MSYSHLLFLSSWSSYVTIKEVRVSDLNRSTGKHRRGLVLGMSKYCHSLDLGNPHAVAQRALPSFKDGNICLQSCSCSDSISQETACCLTEVLFPRVSSHLRPSIPLRRKPSFENCIDYMSYNHLIKVKASPALNQASRTVAGDATPPWA